MPYPALPPKPPLVVQVPVSREVAPPPIPSPVAIPPESSTPAAAGDSFSHQQRQRSIASAAHSSAQSASTQSASTQSASTRSTPASSSSARSLSTRATGASSLGTPLQTEAAASSPTPATSTPTSGIEPTAGMLTVDFSQMDFSQLGQAEFGQTQLSSTDLTQPASGLATGQAQPAPIRFGQVGGRSLPEMSQLAQATAPNLQDLVPIPSQPGQLQPGQLQPGQLSPGQPPAQPQLPGGSIELPEPLTPAPPSVSPVPPPTPPTRPAAPNGAPAVPLPTSPTGQGEAVELRADRQEFELFPQVFTGDGNAELRFRGAVLQSDRVQVNVANRIAVAEGNVLLTRGQQRIQGDRVLYNLIQGTGSLEGARGDLFLPSAERDLAPTLPTDISARSVPTRSIGNQVEANQPFQVTTGSPGLTFGVTSGGRLGGATQPGEVRRLRFEADRFDFTPAGGEGTNVRITNDPFSPPELELRADRVTFSRLSETQSEIRARRPRLVFDQGFSLPLLRNRILLDSRERNPGLIQFGFDEQDKDGFFLEGNFAVLNQRNISLSVTPQVLLQRAIEQGVGASSLGLEARLDAQLTPSTTLFGRLQLNSLDFDDFEDTTRARLQVRQRTFANHTLNLDYVYRDRLFNGSLGFRNVQSSLGLVLTSPAWRLGETGINFSYQAGVQLINATTDFPDLLPAIVTNDRDRRVTLTRYQASAALNRFFPLWVGRPLPATATEGLRYSPVPITPYVGFALGARGVFSGYSSGDAQSSLTGTVSLFGQFGRFSRPMFDYTAFTVSYSIAALDGRSPFLFDRDADQQVLSVGLMQQVYGPFRAGVQFVRNVDTGEEIDTIYSLEYSRRTYAVSLSYSPKREAAAINFRLSDFNWSGDPGPFSGIGADSVSGGVRQR